MKHPKTEQNTGDFERDEGVKTKIRDFEIKRKFREREISAKIMLTEKGICIFLAGGDLPHVGAVSLIGEDTKLETTAFPGHKEAVITEKWAAALYGRLQAPIVISAGIHYDDLTKEEILQVVEITDEMLEKVLGLLKTE